MNNVDLIHQLIRKDLTADGWKQEDIELAIAECIQERITSGANDNTICVKEMSYLKKDSLQIIATVMGKSKKTIDAASLINFFKIRNMKLPDVVKKVVSGIRTTMHESLHGWGVLFKRIWKWLLAIIILLTVILVYGDANSLYKEYLLNKRMKEIHKKEKQRLNHLRDSLHNLKGDAQIELANLIASKNYYILENGGISDGAIQVIIDTIKDDIFEEAFLLIKNKANEGDSKCQELLGHYYLFGIHVNSNYEKSTYWFNEAAKNGNIRALYWLGTAYENGTGVNVDMRKAVECFKKSAEAGDHLAQLHYGDLFVDGVKIKVGSHREKWVPTPDQVMAPPEDGYVIVDDYETLVLKDIKQAKAWWQKAADQGDNEAKERLQKIYN